MELDRLPNFLMTTESVEDNIFETTYTEDPAVERDFYFFNNQKDNVKQQTFQILDSQSVDYERVTSGVWMMPDTKYLRQTEEGDFYTVEFTKEDLFEALKKHLKTGYRDNTQLEHNGNNLVTFETLEYWVIKDENTLSPIYGLSLEDLGYNFEDIPVGTVMKTTYVSDEDFWNDYIMSGKVSGYSIGGLFTMKPDLRDEVMETKQSSLFRSMGLAQKEGSLILNDDSVIDLKEDVKINNEVVKDGEYTTKLGFTLTIKDGQLIEYAKFNEVQEPQTVETQEVVTETVVEDVVEQVEEKVEDVEEPIVPLGESEEVESTESDDVSDGNDDTDNTLPTDKTDNDDIEASNTLEEGDNNESNIEETDKMSAILDRLSAMETLISNQKAEYERKIQEIVKESEAKDEEIVNLKNRYNHSPIKKSDYTPKIGKESSQSNNYVMVGGRKVKVPKI